MLNFYHGSRFQFPNTPTSFAQLHVGVAYARSGPVWKKYCTWLIEHPLVFPIFLHQDRLDIWYEYILKQKLHPYGKYETLCKIDVYISAFPVLFNGAKAIYCSIGYKT